MAVVGATPFMKYLIQRISQRSVGKKLVNVMEPVVLLILLLVMTAYLVDGSFNPFLYFRF